MLWLYPGVVLPLLVWAACCFRLSNWHKHEASFWRRIHRLSLLDMAPDDAPALLRWTKAYPPSFWTKLRGWQAPHVRRRQWESR